MVSFTSQTTSDKKKLIT